MNWLNELSYIQKNLKISNLDFSKYSLIWNKWDTENLLTLITYVFRA